MRNTETGFSKKWPKIVIRGPPTEISGDPVLIDRKFFQNDFGVGGPPISDFWPFFRFPIFEISTNLEKGCFLCCRFFWIGNKNNSVVFSGHPNFFPKKTCECHHCLSFWNRKPGRSTSFYKQKIGGPQKNNTVVFVADSKKTATQKTRFFRVDRNFVFRLLK